MAERLVEKRDSYGKDLADALDRIIGQLSSRPDVHTIILFGSYARGRRDLFTDLDLLVIMDSNLDYVTRTADLYASINSGVDLDLLVYTPDEFDRMRQMPFIKNALADGKVLYEKRPKN